MSANMKIVVGLVALVLLALLSWWQSKKEPQEDNEAAGTPPVPPDAKSIEGMRRNARDLVWAGFHGRAEIIEMIPEFFNITVEESAVAEIVDSEFARKAEAEKTWPERTDCDRLDAAFAALDERGIIAKQYAGYTQSDAHSDIAEALGDAELEGEDKYTGYCFYTAQDVESLLAGQHELHLGFGTNLEQASEVAQALGAPDNVGAIEAGQLICAVLKEFDFDTRWDENPATRIAVQNFDWKRRLG